MFDANVGGRSSSKLLGGVLQLDVSSFEAKSNFHANYPYDGRHITDKTQMPTESYKYSTHLPSLRSLSASPSNASTSEFRHLISCLTKLIVESSFNHQYILNHHAHLYRQNSACLFLLTSSGRCTCRAFVLSQCSYLMMTLMLQQ